MVRSWGTTMTPSKSPKSPGMWQKSHFTPSAAVGMHILGKKFNWSAEVRYAHISNAGIASINPGINTLQVRIGVGMFTRPGGN